MKADARGFRVFIGGWGNERPDWTIVDISGLTWDEAKVLLLSHLHLYDDDTCEHCRSAAADEIRKLEIATPGSFDGDVDGDDYMIIDLNPPRS